MPLEGYESEIDDFQSDDATWVLASTFIIFTMQSGFGLLESGSVSTRNEVNIMVKNAADVICGGFTYWMLGYAFSFGTDPGTNPFCGIGHFFVNADDKSIGWVYSKFFFQASFATTATTIVSGTWVHVVGGINGLVATILLKPRHGRFQSKYPPQMGSPTNAVLGMFMLWWGWLGFNCGSTFGISGSKWKLAARSAVATLNSSMAGGMTGLLLSYVTKRRKLDVSYLINGVLGALVSITALCALAEPWEGIVIGVVGSLIACMGAELLIKLKVDDPVGCVPVHGFCGIWGLLSVGIFGKVDTLSGTSASAGLIYSGSFWLLGIQSIGVLSLIVWTAVIAFVFLKLIDVTVGLRLPLDQELLGSDLVEHDIGDNIYDKVTGTIRPRVLDGPASEDESIPWSSTVAFSLPLYRIPSVVGSLEYVQRIASLTSDSHVLGDKNHFTHLHQLYNRRISESYHRRALSRSRRSNPPAKRGNAARRQGVWTISMSENQVLNSDDKNPDRPHSLSVKSCKKSRVGDAGGCKRMSIHRDA
ncbi:PREDICTED: putative ammonium transporter 3 [Priapulus caudatus]|uniref:Ammonium transporter 3 n=1 Tax=Priapulus caudatus TaxID=37621 RepID=A0ABM1DVW0_PRICU|nr:PREDICTED: putative ammonium transporter 3 [Priapulus caudatus]